jgi:zeta-carotene desaturase
VKSVAVIGGGLAGISAGCALADAGYKVTLFERRPYLGGRASSYEHPGTGEVVDNCQHVLLGCCTNLIDLYRRFGAEDKIRWFTSLTFIEPGGRQSLIAPSMLPAPLHSAPSFFTASSLSLADKLAIARAMLALMGKLPEDTSEDFAHWLARHGQTERAVERFWKPVLVSAINEDLDRISVRYGAQVFRESFLKSAAAGRMGVPKVPLTDLYSRGADYIRSRGGEVRLRASVDKIQLVASTPTIENCHPERSEGSLSPARTAALTQTTAVIAEPTHDSPLMTHHSVAVHNNGNVEHFDYCILAVPYFTIAKLLPDDAPGRELAAAAERFESSPITGIHLWFDRQITDLPHAVLLDRTIQWMFQKSQLIDSRANVGARLASPASQGTTSVVPNNSNKNEEPALAGDTNASSIVIPSPPAAGEESALTHDSRLTTQGSYLELVVSSSKSLVNMKREEIIDLALRELAEFFPQVKDAQLLKAAVIKEVHATYSAQPLSDTYRPNTVTQWPNIFLAGDWTSTGWPATMEGAVRSGYNAAEVLTRAAGESKPFRVPDLPATGLMRLFE